MYVYISRGLRLTRNVKQKEVECGPMPNGRPAEYRWHPQFNAANSQSLADARVPCSNAAKTRNPLKFAGVPQTRQQISCWAEFAILWGIYGGDIAV